MLIPAKIEPVFRNRSGHHDDLDREDPRWFAVRVGHRKEKLTVRLLEREGVECYLPLRDRPFKYKSKTGVRQIPLLGGYLFVRIVTAQALAVLRQTHVFNFVKIGPDRRQIKQREIDLLRRSVNGQHPRLGRGGAGRRAGGG